MTPFIVTIAFMTPVSLHELTTLDAILLGELALEYGDMEAFRRLPLLQTSGVPHASMAYGTRGRARRRVVRPRVSGNDLTSMDVSRFSRPPEGDVPRDYRNRLYEHDFYAIDKLSFGATGDADEVEAILRATPAIGKHRSNGYGAIRDVFIEEVDAWQNFGLVGKDGVPMRQVPMNWWKSVSSSSPPCHRLVRAVPFYWRQDNPVVPCAAPVDLSDAALDRASA